MSDNENKIKLESRKLCSVGLKSPNGLILRLFRSEEVRENTNAGPRTFKQFFPDIKAGTVTLKGYKGAAFGQRQPHRIVGQYAITNDVSLEFMQRWMEQNKEHDLVNNQLIFIMPNENEAAAAGRDHKEVWDGLHPLRMPQGATEAKSKDPRVPKRVSLGSKDGDATDEADVLRKPEVAA
jgi:hypothetical protein